MDECSQCSILEFGYIVLKYEDKSDHPENRFRACILSLSTTIQFTINRSSNGLLPSHFSEVFVLNNILFLLFSIAVHIAVDSGHYIVVDSGYIVVDSGRR